MIAYGSTNRLAFSALRDLVANDDAVLDFKQFDRLNGTSPATRKRLFKAGKGPSVVHLSERRKGIVVRDYKKVAGQPHCKSCGLRKRLRGRGLSLND